MKLSPHFKRSEFACHCCEQVQVDPRLVDALESLRTLVGRPINVESGYRCPKHNKEVKGSPRSQHLSGHAADIWVANMSGRALYELARELPEFRGLGVGANYLHVDVRFGPRSRWRYDANGKAIKFDPSEDTDAAKRPGKPGNAIGNAERSQR